MMNTQPPLAGRRFPVSEPFQETRTLPEPEIDATEIERRKIELMQKIKAAEAAIGDGAERRIEAFIEKRLVEQLAADLLELARKCGANLRDASVTPAHPRTGISFYQDTLSAFRDAVLEEAAVKADPTAWAIAAAIRAMKGTP